MSMTSSRFWLGLRKSQLPATQWLLHAPSEIAALFPVSKTTRPFGWSMTHMLIGIVMSRAFSFGRDGTSPWMLNGPNVPLVVKNTFTCADAVDGTMHSMPSSTAAIPSFLMASSPRSGSWSYAPLCPTRDPLARANIARRLPTCQGQGHPACAGVSTPFPRRPGHGRTLSADAVSSRRQILSSAGIVGGRSGGAKRGGAAQRAGSLGAVAFGSARRVGALWGGGPPQLTASPKPSQPLTSRKPPSLPPSGGLGVLQPARPTRPVEVGVSIGTENWLKKAGS